jgi:hypothetical protein
MSGGDQTITPGPTWHVVLFHHHADGSATQYSWWVDDRYAADMLAHMGAPDMEQMLTEADVHRSIAAGSQVLTFEPASPSEEQQ